MMDWMGWWMLVGGVFGLAVLVLVVLGVVWLVRRLTESRGDTVGDRAEAELRRRYATGEITRDEYRQRLADLREH